MGGMVQKMCGMVLKMGDMVTKRWGMVQKMCGMVPQNVRHGAPKCATWCKTSQELRKPALRVGQLSRCQGVTKLENSNCERKKIELQNLS